MVRCFPIRQNNTLFHDKRRPAYQRYIIYILGLTVLVFCSLWIIRDTTPITFVPPSINDMQRHRGELATKAELENVYWRVTIRATSTKMQEICNENDYHLITHKNILQDGQPMRQSYIFLCKPIDGIQSILNARAVIPSEPENSARCIETYGNKTKVLIRYYPFSLKYISSQTFEPETRVIRKAEEACTWLHAIDIVESVWD